MLPIGGQVFRLQESRAPSRLTVTWEDKCHNAEHPPFLLLPPVLLLSVTSYGPEYPLGQLGSAVPALSPPNSLCTPSLLAGGAV